jgi:hypothetical protein
VNTARSLLADLEIDDVIGNWNRMDATTRDAILVFGALVIVTLVVVLWAAFVRKKKRSREHYHHHRHRPLTETPVVAESQQTNENSGRERRRRKRRRRDHRPRNPTLAETGGLPPIKPEGSQDLVP